MGCFGGAGDRYQWVDTSKGWPFGDAQVAPREGETMADVAENNRKRYASEPNEVSPVGLHTVGIHNDPTAGVRDVATLQGEVDRLQATVESIETHCQHVIRCCGIPGYQAPFASAMAGEILGMIRSWER